MSILLPCPFCGGDPEEYQYRMLHKIKCINCKFNLYSKGIMSDEHQTILRKRWNTRFHYTLSDPSCSPRPWRIESGECIRIKDADGDTVATMTHLTKDGRRDLNEVEENARLIVNIANR